VKETVINRRHWVFDLDGTLTVAVHDFAAIRRELNIPDGSDILGHLDSLPENEATPLHLRLQEIEHELAHQTEAATGALLLVKGLHSRGSRLGVLTRNTRENALRTLELIGLDGYFEEDFILGRDEATPKPDPDGILQLADLWNVNPDEVVMVGDYLYDLQAGRSAGSTTIHIDPAGNFRWPDLADLMIGSLEELSDKLVHCNICPPQCPLIRGEALKSPLTRGDLEGFAAEDQSLTNQRSSGSCPPVLPAAGPGRRV
jgi:HAD superfamily hydrolase (TIGR01509 family)